MIRNIDIDTERKLFEAWYSEDGKYRLSVERNEDSYKLMQAAQSWIAWQARAALIAPQQETMLSDERITELAERCMDHENKEFLLRQFIAEVDQERTLLAKAPK